MVNNNTQKVHKRRDNENTPIWMINNNVQKVHINKRFGAFKMYQKPARQRQNTNGI
jgi:hypothetical protein